ncbi:MAG: family 43 glycosylhydrolase [Lachnospiraceae bacterium]|nr:family 43 glycosylhydrolase [Lachnospiraceae bacterium]
MSFESVGPVLSKAPVRDRQAFNPYLPSWEYIPDGEPYVFDGRVYVYGSHDRFGGQVFCMNDYVCWSADVNDLTDWRYEGVIYPKTSDPLNRDGSMCLYAPDVAKGADGRYYLYYVLDKVSVVSVAVCDTPAGRFEYLGNVHYPDGTLLGDREGDEPQFDPGVLYEDGKVYLFTGFCGHGDKSRHGAMLTILDKDMLTVLAPPRIVAPGACYAAGTPYEGHAFFEAPSIRKRGDLYYFIYSSQVMHELCYATSDRPDGEFTYGGVIVSNTDLGIDSYKKADVATAYGANNHGSMEKINDDWYIFYHRHTNNTWYARQGCAEKLSFDENGKICQAEITSCGLNGGPLCDRGEYPAYILCNLFDEKHSVYVGEGGAPYVTQEGGDGVQCTGYLNGIHDKVTAGFKYFDLKGVTGLKIRTKGYFAGEFEVRNSYDGEVLGRIKVDFRDVWTESSSEFTIPDGVSALYLTFRGTGNGCLNSFEFLHG